MPRLIKATLNRSLANDLDHQIAVERGVHSEADMSDNFREGIRALMEKTAGSVHWPLTSVVRLAELREKSQQ